MMTVKIDRYVVCYDNNDKWARIFDKEYNERIVNIETRNPLLTKVLAVKCMETLNQGFEYND